MTRIYVYTCLEVLWLLLFLGFLPLIIFHLFFMKPVYCTGVRNPLMIFHTTLQVQMRSNSNIVALRDILIA